MWSESQLVEVAIGQISGFHQAFAVRTEAAYELFVELSTRTATLTDDDDLRSPRDILEDLASLSGTTRQILRNNGADSAKGRKDGNVTLAVVALRVLNEIIAPRVNLWLPLLELFDDADEETAGADDLQERPDAGYGEWNEDVCARDLESMRFEIRTYMDTLARIAGAPALSDLVEPPPPSTPIAPQVLSTPLDIPEGRTPRTRMVRWFDPLEGVRTLLAHTKAKKDAQVGTRGSRTDGTAGPIFLDANGTIKDESGDVWVDYVSDMGDAIDPTLAVAWQLTQPAIALPIDRTGALPSSPPDLKRGALLIMGGDQIYPYADEEKYNNQLDLPYELACSANPDTDEIERQIVAIPGNHDWYGGIKHFEKVFVGGDKEFPVHSKQWKAPQTERWWAVKIRTGWWIWGIDTALDDSVDPDQVEYFERASRALAPGDQVIVCSPVPLWQLRQKREIDYFELRGLLRKLIEERGARTPLFLAGDSHFFAHYRRVDGVAAEHHITAGGGGAFLQPTHNLAEQVPLERGSPDFKLTARWPRPVDSRSLAGKVSGISDRQFWLLFPILGLIHALYAALLGIDSDIGDPDDPYRSWSALNWVLAHWAGWPVLALLVFLMMKSTAPNSQERSLRSGASRYGLLHGVVQAAGFVLIAAGARWISGNSLWLFVVAPLLGGIVTTGIGVTALGWINKQIKANDTAAYSSAHLTRYKHFVRMRFTSTGDLEVYVIGLDPVGKDWTRAIIRHEEASAPAEPKYATQRRSKSDARTTGQKWSNQRLVPPFDPAGSPKLHYVWGKKFRAASDHLIVERERELGKEHPDTIFSRLKRAQQLASEGSLDAAKALIERNLASCARTYSPDHDVVLANRGALAAVFASFESWDEAIDERVKVVLEREAAVAAGSTVPIGLANSLLRARMRLLIDLDRAGAFADEADLFAAEADLFADEAELSVTAIGARELLEEGLKANYGDRSGTDPAEIELEESLRRLLISDAIPLLPKGSDRVYAQLLWIRHNWDNTRDAIAAARGLRDIDEQIDPPNDIAWLQRIRKVVDRRHDDEGEAVEDAELVKTQVQVWRLQRLLNECQDDHTAGVAAERTLSVRSALATAHLHISDVISEAATEKALVPIHLEQARQLLETNYQLIADRWMGSKHPAEQRALASWTSCLNKISEFEGRQFDFVTAVERFLSPHHPMVLEARFEERHHVDVSVLEALLEDCEAALADGALDELHRGEIDDLALQVRCCVTSRRIQGAPPEEKISMIGAALAVHEQAVSRWPGHEHKMKLEQLLLDNDQFVELSERWRDESVSLPEQGEDDESNEDQQAREVQLVSLEVAATWAEWRDRARHLNLTERLDGDFVGVNIEPWIEEFLLTTERSETEVTVARWRLAETFIQAREPGRAVGLLATYALPDDPTQLMLERRAELVQQANQLQEELASGTRPAKQIFIDWVSFFDAQDYGQGTDAAFQAMERVWLGRWQSSTGDYDGALEQMEQALAACTAYHLPISLDLLLAETARLSQRCGDPQRAAALYQRQLDLDEPDTTWTRFDHAEAQVGIALAHAQLGELADARNLLQTASSAVAADRPKSDEQRQQLELEIAKVRSMIEAHAG